jgi:hypothetical protein
MMSPPVVDRHAYAWNWFALHSAQRMQLVNFWLVSAAFLGATFVQARVSNLTLVAVGVCVAGAVSSIAFLLLDVRTRALVQVGERALAALENEMQPADTNDEFHLVRNADTSRPAPVVSYYIIIRGLQTALAALFMAAAVQSMFP